MALRFVVGRSGAGKTHHCANAIQKQLAQSPQGDPLILLVPEQATFQMEQGLLGNGKIKGYHRAYVSSFERLAKQLIAEVRPLANAELSELGKQMVLRRLLQELGGKLIVFGKSANKKGFVSSLSQIIRELRQYDKSCEDLESQKNRLLSTHRAELRPLAEKLDDLQLLYSEYQNYIEGRFIDPDDYFDIAGDCCDRAKTIKNAKLWVDGFAEFTPQQYRLLENVLRQVECAEIMLCLDPQSEQFDLALNTETNSADKLDQMDFFYRTLRTCRRLQKIAKNAGIDQQKTLILPEDENNGYMPRFAESQSLAILEKNLLKKEIEINLRNSDAKGEKNITTNGIAIIEAANRRQEVEAAAECILELCRQQGYRFRDIAVILRDLDGYRENIEAIFGDYKIPYFMDQRFSVRHHPLVELLRSAVLILANNFKTEYVISYLKTDLAKLTRRQVDRLENYVLACGVEFGKWYEKTPWQQKPDKQAECDLDEIEQLRKRAVGPLLKLQRKCRENTNETQKSSARDMTAAIAELLEELEVEKELANWCQNANVQETQQHEQVYAEVVKLLDDMAVTLADTPVTPTEYAEILNGALRQLQPAMVPPAIDQVIVGTVERSRHPNINTAFVLGVNEGNFPAVAVNQGLLTESQREWLIEEGFEIAPTKKEQLLHERYLGYIAFTRPRRFLWVSYAAADEMGRRYEPSRFIKNIQTAVPETKIVRLADSGRANTNKITNTGQLALQLAMAEGELRAGRQVDPIWGQLYRAATADQQRKEQIDTALAGATYQNQAKIDAQIASRLFKKTLAGSISRLECFAECPFKHFSKYILRLQRRQELQLQPENVGSFYHAVLCGMFGLMEKQKLGWDQLQNEQIDKFVEQIARDLTVRQEQIVKLLAQSPRNEYLLARATERLKIFCRSLRNAAQKGQFKQKYAELSFGYGRAAGPLEIELAEKNMLYLQGQIDRVDLCQRPDGKLGLCVVDYKSSDRSFAFGTFYHGLSLQLMSYLLYLTGPNTPAANEKCEPAGCVYWPVIRAGSAQSGYPPQAVLQRQKTEEETVHKAKGLISGDWTESLDSTVEPGKTSQYFGFGINRDGSVRDPKRSGIVRPDEMGKMLGHCKQKLIEMAENILKGEISVGPYQYGAKVACEYCEFDAVCRFDRRFEKYRKLTQLNKVQVLERLGIERQKGKTDGSY